MSVWRQLQPGPLGGGAGGVEEAIRGAQGTSAACPQDGRRQQQVRITAPREMADCQQQRDSRKSLVFLVFHRANVAVGAVQNLNDGITPPP